MSSFEKAKGKYQDLGVHVDQALADLGKVKISLHCWQGDDVTGFEGQRELSGGIAATGSYPGRARNPRELMADIDQALCLIPGRHKINLHASYAITSRKIDRDGLEPQDFQPWVEFAEYRGLGLDFNPTFFSHPKAADSLTLSHPDSRIRDFWVEHGRASRRIAEHFGRVLGGPSLNNIWVPDGYKDVPADRYGPRARLKESLDRIYEDRLDPSWLVDSVESKVFGLGLESFTVGSHEFYMNYAAKNNLLCLLDVGHFHPTEVISDKIPSLLLFSDRLALHVSRPVRWDSDHVVILDGELMEIAKEIVRCRALDRVLIGLDFFDAGINRVAAWVVGMRNMQKALLYALLLPHQKLADLQNEGRFTELMVLQEELKLYPWGEIWERFCEMESVPGGTGWYQNILEYEKSVQFKRR